MQEPANLNEFIERLSTLNGIFFSCQAQIGGWTSGDWRQTIAGEREAAFFSVSAQNVRLKSSSVCL
jgi:hypothetical protein